MLYGVFSDVHSNLEALDRVLGFLEDSGAEGYICLGDLVGYGPQPDECLSRIRGLRNLSIVCGNHDLAAIGRMDLEWFNPYARAAVLWTQRRISKESRAFLAVLEAKLETDNFTLAHGTPRKPPEEYLLSPAQFQENVPYVRVWPLFVGHSHMPLCFRTPDKKKGKAEVLFLEDSQEVRIARTPSRVLPIALNPGSVGQPRDHDPRASCALFDSEKGTFRLSRLDYDIPAVQAKIREAGLPEFLALRLAFGQ